VEALVSLEASGPLFSQQDGVPHRGCLTPQMLGTLSKYGVERIAGFSSLHADDQARVRQALKTRRIDPAAKVTRPSSSQPVSQPSSSQQTSAQMPPPNEKKRKAVTVSDVLQSQNVAAPSPTQAAARRAVIGGAAWEEGADADEVVEQQVDELFCSLSSNVVGVQYYKGGFILFV
jgi:SWI/SNF-related matrix-associated actin-dependent regulator of chromatin subfamily A3